MQYQINLEHILFTELAGDGVVYDTKKNEYVTLNETFFKIFKGVEEGKTKQELVSILCREYDITEADCLIEINKSLNQLEEKEYIRVKA